MKSEEQFTVSDHDFDTIEFRKPNLFTKHLAKKEAQQRQKNKVQRQQNKISGAKSYAKRKDDPEKAQAFRDHSNKYHKEMKAIDRELGRCVVCHQDKSTDRKEVDRCESCEKKNQKYHKGYMVRRMRKFEKFLNIKRDTDGESKIVFKRAERREST